MKLSDNTLNVLKNFGSINDGIAFKKGKVLKTVSSHKNILAHATIPDEITSDFCISNLNEFLSVVSLYKDDLNLEFDSKNVVLTGLKGRSNTKYRTCDISVIVAPPEKELQVPSPEIVFELSAEDFDWILRTASVLGSPNVAIQSDGKEISASTFDQKNDGSHEQSLVISKNGSGNKYKMVFKTEVIDKLMRGPYEVKISSKGISHFTNKKIPIQYWVTTEAGSVFEKA